MSTTINSIMHLDVNNRLLYNNKIGIPYRSHIPEMGVSDNTMLP